MAEILLMPSDSDSLSAKYSPAMIRFRRAVAREGIVAAAGQWHRKGAMTKSQKRRLKSLKARKRARRAFARQFGHIKPDRFDTADRKKIIEQDHPVFHSDVKAATGNETWDPTQLVVTRIDFDEIVEQERERAAKQRANEKRFGERAFPKFGSTLHRPPVARGEDEIPSVHSAVIAVRVTRGKAYFPIVRSLNDDGSEREKWQFPGGGTQEGETPEAAGARETKEETGYTIMPVTADDRISTQPVGVHTFICFLSMVTGGRLRRGEEIVEIKLCTYEELCEMADGELSPKHLKAFRQFQARFNSLFQANKAVAAQAAKEVA